jgi:hypothetical protein
VTSGARDDILERIGTWLPTAAGLLGAYVDELEGIQVSDRHKAEHIKRIREGWERRHRDETAVAAHMAALQLRGFPGGVVVRIVRNAIETSRADAVPVVSGRFAKLVRAFEDAATRDAWIRILAAWLAGVPPDVTAWFEAVDTDTDTATEVPS